MSLLFWLMQATPEGGSDSTATIRMVAGGLAVALVIIILWRRKRKASKDDWS